MIPEERAIEPQAAIRDEENISPSQDEWQLGKDSSPNDRLQNSRQANAPASLFDGQISESRLALNRRPSGQQITLSQPTNITVSRPTKAKSNGRHEPVEDVETMNLK